MTIKASYAIANDANVSESIITRVKSLATAAFNQWGAVLAGNANLKVRIEFIEQTGAGRADGTSQVVAAGIAGGKTIWEAAPAYELRTGQDSGLDWDVRIRFTKDYLLNVLYLDKTPSTDDVPANATDGLSVLVHEIGHAFGFNGYYGSRGVTPSVYDERLTGSDAKGLFFNGRNTKALYGGPVPLTIGNYAHYGNTNAAPSEADPLTGLMNGVVFYNGHRYTIDDLDLAFMADMGVGTIRNDVFDLRYMKAFTGGRGNDTYYVYDTATTITEKPGEGLDTAISSVSYTLPASMEILTLTGGAVNGVGNTGANTITGNAASNRLTGNAGNDTLSGGVGNDTLDGGAGNDRMTGGSGNDTYHVDSRSDVVIEAAGGGSDTVSASISYTLGTNLEKLVLTGRSGISGTGNALANTITGNTAANKLSGAAGNDTMLGGAGADTLDGGAGDDRLTGGTGKDVMTGGTGKDRFIFAPGDFGGKTAATADRITDFRTGDRIDLSAVDARSTTAKNDAFVFIGSKAFSGHAGELRYTHSGGMTLIAGDTNGDKVDDFMIRLDNQVALKSADFIL